MSNKCQIENHLNNSISKICLAEQCQGKRVCCSKCQVQFHQNHSVDQFVNLDYFIDFITNQSQKPNEPSHKVMQELKELNNILKDIDDLTELIRQEIQKLESTNLQSFCKNLGNQYKIFTEQIGNQQWNDLVQDMLSKVELKEGELVEKDSLITHLGKPYSHFLSQFSQTLIKMVKELKTSQQTINQNQNFIEQKKIRKEQNQSVEDENDEIIDSNPFLNLTESHILKGHSDTIYAIDICEQKNLLVSGSHDHTVTLWNLHDNSLIKTYKTSGIVYDVAFSSQGNYLAYGDFSNLISLIETKDFKNYDIFTELKGHTNSVTRLTFSLDQIYLVSGSYDNTVRIWNVRTLEELIKLETGFYVFGLAIKSDNTLIVSHSKNTGIKVWEFKSQQLLLTQQGHPDGMGIIFSNDEKQLISSGSDGKIKIWSLLDQGKLMLIKEFLVANNKIQKVLLTSDSKFILFYCYEDLQVNVIDSNAGEKVIQFEISTYNQCTNYFLTGGVAITKNMKMLAYGNDNQIVVLRMK